MSKQKFSVAIMYDVSYTDASEKISQLTRGYINYNIDFIYKFKIRKFFKEKFYTLYEKVPFFILFQNLNILY